MNSAQLVDTIKSPKFQNPNGEMYVYLRSPFQPPLHLP